MKIILQHLPKFKNIFLNLDHRFIVTYILNSVKFLYDTFHLKEVWTVTSNELYLFSMPRKSIVEIRNSEIRWKNGSQQSRASGRITNSMLVSSKNRKRQRRLFEFDIPTTSDLPIKQRNGPPLLINEPDDPIIIDEDGFNNNRNNHIDSQQYNDIEIIENDDEFEVLEDIIVTERPVNTEISINKEEMDEIPQPNDISCPICSQDLSNLELYEKEAHCEHCLEQLSKEDGSISLDFTKEESVDLALSVQSEKCVRKKNGKNKKAVKSANRKKVDRTGGRSKPRAPLPRIKIITFENGYKLVVDGFNYESDVNISKYFLSHFHSDHYIGLKKSWEQGQIYCSQITSDLMKHKFKIPEDRIIILINDERTWITNSICVTAFDANHCPGAQVYLFQEYSETKHKEKLIRQFIHTGDFRSNDTIVDQFSNRNSINSIYLDTTYLSHTNNFPLQDEIVRKTTDYVKEYFNKKDEMFAKRSAFNIIPVPKKKLVLVGAYAIGKEKLAMNIGERLGCRCFVYNDELRSYFMNCTGKENNGIAVHLVPLGVLRNEESILKYLKEVVCMKWLDVSVVGIIPTGWTYGNIWQSKNLTLSREDKIKYTEQAWINKDEDMLPADWFLKQVNGNKKFQIFKVPYSEHSSFNDLVRFSTSGKFVWDKILATVNIENIDRARDMSEWFEIWKKINEVKFSGGMIE